MKILVTGGSGYFGSLLIDKLLEKGFDVGSLDINKSDDLPSGVMFHQIDVRDVDSLKKGLLGYDLIFHNVAQVPLAKNKKLFCEKTLLRHTLKIHKNLKSHFKAI